MGKTIYAGEVKLLFGVGARVSGFDDGQVMLTLASGGLQSYCLASPDAMRLLASHLVAAADALDEAALQATRPTPVGVCTRVHGDWTGVHARVPSCDLDRNAVQRIPRAALRASDTRPETEHSDADPGL